MAVSRTISLPDDILHKAEELAAREQMSLEELVTAALFGEVRGRRIFASAKRAGECRKV
jgi:predicted transcriptional regulator